MRRVLVLALIWGWSFLFIKVAVAGMTPTTVAAARCGLGMIVVLGILFARGHRLPRDLTSWRHFTVMALVHSAVPFSLVAWSEERITSALASVLNASTGLFTALCAAAFLGERLRRSQHVGLVCGFAGVGVAAGLGLSDVAGANWTGAGAVVVASAMYALGFAYAERNLAEVPVLVAAGGQLVMATALAAPFAALTTVRHGIDLTPTRVVAIVLLGMVGTGYAYLLNYRSIIELGSTRASLVTYFVVVVAVVVGVVVLDEPFELGLVIGAALIVVGVLLVQGRLRRLRTAPVVALALLVALVGGACGGENNSGGNNGRDTDNAVPPGQQPRCGLEVEEQLDPNSARHVFPDAPPPSYVSDPPTSGPHAAGAGAPTGVLGAPLTKPQQVQLLEHGTVLLQHRDLTGAERRTLEALAGDGVTVAPNPDLPERIVATAWTRKMLCEDVGTVDLRRFVADYAKADVHGGHPAP